MCKGGVFLKLKRVLFFVLIGVILLSSAAISYFRKALRPTVVSMAQNYALREATVKINECVFERLGLQEDLYESFVNLNKDSQGNVIAISANTQKTNILKSRLSVDVAKALEEIKGQSFDIPVGNVINGNIFAGKGPNIEVKIISVGAVTTDFRNEFKSGAINQTLHRIMLDVSVNISLYVPFSLTDVKVSTSVCVAETVLVGKVPDAYTYVVENGDGLAGEINDYGADNFLQ